MICATVPNMVQEVRVYGGPGDGSSQASPIPWTDFCPTGTSASLMPLAEEDPEMGGYNVDAWFVASLAAGATYVMKNGDSYYAELGLYRPDGTFVSSQHWEEDYEQDVYGIQPISYAVPAGSGGLYTMHAVASYEVGDMSVSPRPDAYSPVGTSTARWLSGEGYDAAGGLRRFQDTVGAKVSPGIPADHVALRDDFSDLLKANTGQVLQIRNGSGVTKDTQDGIPCAKFADGCYLQAKSWKGVAGSAPKSVSVWIKTYNTDYDAWSILSWGSNASTGNLWNMQKGDGQTLVLNGHYADVVGAVNIKDGKWHHCCAVYYGGLARLYVDGVMDGTGSFTLDTGGTTPFRIGCNHDGDPQSAAKCYMAALRVYDRALTSAEVLGLSREFSPKEA